MNDFKPRRPRTTDEPREEHPLIKLAIHLVMLLLTLGLFIYTLMTQKVNGIGPCFASGGLFMWLLTYTTQKMPARRFMRAVALLLILGAIAIVWVVR